jgi:N-hydroxyarylamine O-acetyltransferase
MPDYVINLDAYCARIGYLGERTPTLATLRDILRGHATSIPFENLDVLLGRRISIEPSAVEQKLVHDRRGGYCFEQSTLMMHALRELGFDVSPLIGRIRWQVPPDVLTNLGHMRLRVDLGGVAYVADPGLGSLTLTAPLELAERGEQNTHLERRRLIPEGAFLREQVNFGESWSDVCIFSPDAASLPDFELGNWYYCTHPESLFVRNLVVARPAKDRRYSIFNREFAVRHADGSSVKEIIASPEQLRSLLHEHFGLDLDPGLKLQCPGLDFGETDRTE